MKLNHGFHLFMGMVLVLFIAFISDRWINLAILRSQDSFDGGNSIMFAHPIGQFVTVGMCISLYRFVINKAPPNFTLSLLYISIGLLLLFYNIIIIQFSSLNFKTIRFLYPFSSSNLHLTAGAFIGLIGFINLKRLNRETL